MKIVRIPKERVGVLIGKKGEEKRFLEEKTGVVIDVDSESGEITINCQNAKNPLFILQIESIVRAIGRGFSPEKAYQLLRDDMYLDIIDMRDYAGKSPKHMRRIKARIIGKEGRTRKNIEQLTGAYLSIYGGTVAILCNVEGLETARNAIDMLLGGSEHSMVYRYLERKRREMKMAKLDSIFDGALSAAEDGHYDDEDDLDD